MTDETRLQVIQWQLRQCEAVNEVLLIVHSTVGEPVQGLSSLSDRLKRMISVLLDGMHRQSVHPFDSIPLPEIHHRAPQALCDLIFINIRFVFLSFRRDFNLQEALEGVSAQICCELNKSLIERKYPALTPELQATLTGQICSISQKNNPIRTLVGKI